MDVTYLNYGILTLTTVIFGAFAIQLSHLRREVSKLATAKPKETGGSSDDQKQRPESDLQTKAEAIVEARVNAASKQIEKDLAEFSKQLQTTLLDQASNSVARGLAEPQNQIIAFNAKLNQTIQDLTQGLTQASQAGHIQLQADLEQQKKLLIDQFQQHLASVVSAYIISALGEEAVDGDQASRVIKQLEAHKDALQKDLLHE
jgi:hypothetical protein